MSVTDIALDRLAVQIVFAPFRCPTATTRCWAATSKSSTTSLRLTEI